MNFKDLTIFILLLASTAISGQTGAYVATDSSLSTRVKLIQSRPKDNSQFIRQETITGLVKHSPEQLSEYGFKNGTVFVSREILLEGKSKKVFLERLAKGQITLYYYIDKDTKTFFLELDSVLVELGKDKNFRDVLETHTNDFEWKTRQVKTVNYSKKSLTSLIDQYNSGKNKPIPFTRFGLLTGPITTSWRTPPQAFNTYLNNSSFSNSSAISYGLFIDVPLSNSISINAGLNISEAETTTTTVTLFGRYNALVEIISVDIPLLVRYTLPTLRIRPFINAGLMYSYNLKNENAIYRSEFRGSLFGVVPNQEFISRSMFGPTYGFGLQYAVHRRKVLSVEFRGNYLFMDQITLNKSQAAVLFGLSF